MTTAARPFGSWVLFWGALVVAGIHLAAWAAFERLIRPVEGEKAQISLDALLVSAEQTLQASHYLEERVVTRLKTVAREVIGMDPAEHTSDRLESIRRQNEFRSITLYDGSGLARESSDPALRSKPLPEEFVCHQLLHGGMEEHVFGFSQGVFCESDAFGYARRTPDGGIIRIVTGVEFVLGFEKSLGLAALLERFRRDPGVHRLDFVDANGHSLLPPAASTGPAEITDPEGRLTSIETGETPGGSARMTGSGHQPSPAPPIHNHRPGEGTALPLPLHTEGGLVKEGTAGPQPKGGLPTSVEHHVHGSEAHAAGMPSSPAPPVENRPVAGRRFRSRPLLLHDREVGHFELDFTDLDLQALSRTAALFFAFSGFLSFALLALVFTILKRRGEAEEKDRQIAETRLRIEGLGQVVAAVAHEMRNPLNTVALSLAGLRADLEALPADGRLLERLDLVDSTTRQANNLLKNLLQTTRPLLPSPAEMDLPSWMARLRSSFEAAFPGVRGRFVSQGEARFVTDPDFLQQIAWNLLLNAAQAGSKEVDCTVKADDQGLELTVADDGPGLPAEVRQNLFVPGCTTRAEGSGLGLYNCQRRCAALGGTIDATNPSRGTTFTVRIPASEGRKPA